MLSYICMLHMSNKYHTRITCHLTIYSRLILIYYVFKIAPILIQTLADRQYMSDVNCGFNL